MKTPIPQEEIMKPTLVKDLIKEAESKKTKSKVADIKKDPEPELFEEPVDFPDEAIPVQPEYKVPPPKPDLGIEEPTDESPTCKDEEDEGEETINFEFTKEPESQGTKEDTLAYSEDSIPFGSAVRNIDGKPDPIPTTFQNYKYAGEAAMLEVEVEDEESENDPDEVFMSQPQFDSDSEQDIMDAYNYSDEEFEANERLTETEFG